MEKGVKRVEGKYNEVSADEILRDIGGKEISNEKISKEIGGREILESSGGDKLVVKDLTPIQREGIRLLYFVGYIMIIIIIFLLTDFILNIVQHGNLNENVVINLNENYIKGIGELSDIVINRISKIFDTFIVKAFLPVFTTILGYVFGSNSEKGE